ncbi:DMT family transporter [Rhodocytophaga rosea]|uniref:DMT family transporter n=1 Tax=Rhodocytophaga rosea TaxID=2704465 RepID=A0A6C0GTP3_9BACT|nr:DMT family transporter [Rhodocytophaga rosea]QHT71277.1 DMT family transporter [Rhodocytophaga rosea]
MTTQPALKDYLQLHFIVLIWGFTAILGLLISIPAVELVFFRILLSILFLAVLLYVRKKKFSMPVPEMLKLMSTGALIAAHWILFFGAARVSTASICLAGMATSSLWTSLTEPLIRGRRISVLEIFLGLVVIVGLYVVFHFEFNHALGITMAIGSALLAALFSVINAGFTNKHDAFVITFYEMIGAFLTTGLFLPVYRYYLTDTQTLQLNPTLTDWLYIAILAGICTVYAYSLAVRLMKKFTAFAMNLTINLEPVYGIVLAFLFFGDAEKMTPGFYFGTVIILAAVLLYPVLKRNLSSLKLKRAAAKTS